MYVRSKGGDGAQVRQWGGAWDMEDTYDAYDNIFGRGRSGRALPCRPYCVVSTENPGPFSLNRAGFVELLLLRVKTRISRR